MRGREELAEMGQRIEEGGRLLDGRRRQQYIYKYRSPGKLLIT